jgi:hypothetical protein
VIKDKVVTDHFQSLNTYIYNSQIAMNATAAESYIIMKGVIVNEWYSGRHNSSEESQPILTV